MTKISFTNCLIAIALLAFGMTSYADDKIDYNREVRPILSTKCFQCHGPDEESRKVGLRLDVRDIAIKKIKSGGIPIVPGNPEDSTIMDRVTTTDADDIMPPQKTGPPLKEKEIAILKKWIEEGANYSPHWAYVKPVSPHIPAVKNKAWPINDLDRIVLSNLERQNLKPQAQADGYALIRRVSLDLTGLPPTIEETERFVHDNSPDGYEKLVDRLLAMPAYGERWAQLWLDLARYADSAGFANDPERTIWAYRDWVIHALNSNMPFDQFTFEQIAGDMLEKPTQDQLIATGFHRNTLTNSEGGTQPEEFRSAAIVDRVNTTMQVWTASTFNCSQCHNHKYDPFSQKEYYQLYAIFNNTADANKADESPTIRVARSGKEKQYNDLQSAYLAAENRFNEASKDIDKHRADWEKTVVIEQLPKDIQAIFKKPAKERKKPESNKLTEYFRSQSADWKKIEGDYNSLKSQSQNLSITTPIMREAATRPTHIHLRGNYEAKGEAVTAALPASMQPTVTEKSINRLVLARWLVNPDHPLTARVAVNRLWEQLFGVGIVETAEDFGLQGELPSDQKLLDYLAVQYINNAWDTKKILKMIVMSATYKQSSRATAEQITADPRNRMLARGPRVRLSAETIRDQALFASGLLSDKMYGPPCQPPKPSFGLSAAFGGTTDWTADTGTERYRRALYIRVRRNAPYPSMTTFDAPERTSCTVRRIRTNTPLQALVTLNDPCYVEAAQALARKILTSKSDVKSQARFAFQSCLCRPPTDAELDRIVKLFDSAKTKYTADETLAKKMAADPLGPLPSNINAIDAASWTLIGNVLLNLDETLSN